MTENITLISHSLSQKAQAQSFPAGALYVIATPIGNLADLSFRALAALAIVDCVVCEDTRVTGNLLNQLGLKKALIAGDMHREAGICDGIVSRLQSGQRVGLVSDAGTPAISDPGSVLISAAHAASLPVITIAGASSVTLAASASGLVSGAFNFAGFAPNKGGARSAFYETLGANPAAQVWLEAPHRIEDAAQLLAKLAPNRALSLSRELTKQFEQTVRLSAGELASWLAAKPERIKGEFVLTLGAKESEASQAALSETLQQAINLARQLSADLPASRAAAQAAQFFKQDKKTIYAALHADNQAND